MTQPAPRQQTTPPKKPDTAIPLSPNTQVSPAKKQMMNLIMIFSILFFVGAGIYIFGKGKIFDTGSGGGGFIVSGEPTWDKPRDALPMGVNTRFFGSTKSYIQKDPNGAKRGQYYYLHSPAGAAASGRRYPLVIFLHDEKGLADGAVNLLTKEMQQSLPAYVLVPMAAPQKTWAVPEKFHGEEFAGKAKGLFGYWTPRKFPAARQFLPDVMGLTATLLSRMPSIDDGRVYIVGCGEGAIGVYGALANYGEFFAGGVAASGLWSYSDANKLKSVPLLIMHGAKDLTIPVLHAQTMEQVIRQVGGTQVVYQEFADLAHNCADPRLFSPPVWQWLFTQKKPPLPSAAPTPAAATSAPAGDASNPDAPPEMMPEMQAPPPPMQTAP